MDGQESKTSFVSARLVILLFAAGGLALVFAFRTSSPQAGLVEEWSAGKDLKEISQYELPGEEPEEPAEFDIQIEVDTSTIKNRLVMHITELHGYYVETLDVRFWWKGDDPDLEREDATTYSFVYHINNYIKANETFKDCIEVTAPEIVRVHGDVGTPENWGVRIERYHRARAQNPEEFPRVSTTGRYCS